MSVIGKLKVSSGGKLKISSGKMKVEPVGISTTFSVKHQNNASVEIVVRYSIGLTNTVSYSSGYLLRGEATLAAESSQTTLALGTVFIPGAIANDGTVDAFLRAESPTEIFGDIPFVDGFGGYQAGSDFEGGLPNQSNGRYEIKLSASPATIVVNDVEWDI